MKKAGEYDAGNLPMGKGVAYFFDSSKDDALRGGSNRRLLHYNWCAKAFKQKLLHVRQSHFMSPLNLWTTKSDRTLQAAWLEDVLNLRLPAISPTDGNPYELIPVDPSTQGGHMSVGRCPLKAKSHDYTNVQSWTCW